MASQPRAPRIGMYGGAFDPPHLAHRALIEQALSELRLDRLHVVPTGQAWHKPRGLSGAVHRVAMCQLAFADLSAVVVDEREGLRQTASFTVETLRELHQEYPGSPICLIIGADQARTFDQWKAWPDIFDLATVCVAQRQDADSGPVPLHTDESIASRFVGLDFSPMKTSATDIRSRVAEGLALDALVSTAVAGYIARHHLYTEI